MDYQLPFQTVTSIYRLPQEFVIETQQNVKATFKIRFQIANAPVAANGAAALPATSGQKRFAHSVEEASFDVVPYKLHLLTEGPELKVSLTRTNALEHYRDLVS